MDLREIVVRPVRASEEQRYQERMRQHHYLGALLKISETLSYVATWHEEWMALVSFSASALKCAARDGWIGWDFRHRSGRLKLIANNSRFLILPKGVPNLGSRILALCRRRLPSDWEATFGHRVLLLETVVDPQRFRGTVYRAANWVYVGNTKGFRLTRREYSATPQSPQRVFVQPLETRERQLSCGAPLPSSYRTGESKRMLSVAPMQSLPAFFREIPDPRRAQGRRHRLSTVLALAADAVLCGRRGYRSISDWAKSLGPKARERFGCRRENGRSVVPSEFIIRHVLIRVAPADLDRALRRWSKLYAAEDETLAIDGKTICHALDYQGRPTHVMSVAGHQTQTCYAKKKWAPCP